LDIYNRFFKECEMATSVQNTTIKKNLSFTAETEASPGVNARAVSGDGERRPPPRAVTCPKCHRKLEVAHDTDSDATIRCGGCIHQFPLMDGLSGLDFLEIKLPAMVVGLWVFFSQRIPVWCWGTVVRLLRRIEDLCDWLIPYSLKLARVCCWLVVWLTILLGPTIGLIVSGAYFSSKHFSLGLCGLGVLWFLAIGMASAWAYRSYRGKRKQSRMALSLASKVLARFGIGRTGGR
jgi:hypothetical protein